MKTSINTQHYALLQEMAVKNGLTMRTMKKLYAEAYLTAGIENAERTRIFNAGIEKAKSLSNKRKSDCGKVALKIYTGVPINFICSATRPYTMDYTMDYFAGFAKYCYMYDGHGESLHYSYRGENGIFFAGLTERQRILLSAVYSAISAAAEMESGGYVVPLRAIYTALNPNGQWRHTSAEDKQALQDDLTELKKTLQGITGEYKCAAFGNVAKTYAITRKSGFYLDFSLAERNGEIYLVKITPPKAMEICDAQKRVVAIPEKMAEITCRGDFALKYFFAYRVMLSRNVKNSLHNAVRFDYLGKNFPDFSRDFCKGFFRKIKEFGFVDAYTFSQSKITWENAIDSNAKDFAKVIKISDRETLPEMPQEIKDRAVQIASYNDFIKNHNVTDGEGNRLSTALQSVFCRGDYSHGGRLYTAKGGYQGLTQDERHNIKIDGQTVCELDFKSLHIKMIYDIEGVELTEDPYGFTADRQQGKKTSLIMINAKDCAEAVGAVSHALEIDSTEARELLEKARVFHKPIAPYFCSDFGVTLQRIDSDIATAILAESQNRKIPCLCMHDSFLCPEKNKAELYSVMERAYVEIMHRKPLAIEEK